MKKKLERNRIAPLGGMIGLMVLCAAGIGWYWADNAMEGSHEAVWAQSVDTAMGTIVSQRVDAGDEGEKLTGQILKEITDLEEEILSWRLETSQVCQINSGSAEALKKEAEQGKTQSAAANYSIEISGELQGILESCLELAEASGGALDITIGEAARLWNIDTLAVMEPEEWEDYVLPSAEEIRRALADTGYEKVTLQGQKLTMEPGVQLDLGAVGKGAALDRVCTFLENHDEVQGAVISVGGSILTYGEKRNAEPWNVAVTNPFDTSKTIGYLALRGQWCVSTSGDYERYVEIDGVRYHHIIDPATGYPADSGVCSVTILTKDGLLSDGLSTACFVLGEEKGRKLAERYGAEALFVGKDGEITMTAGMEDYFHGE